MRLKSWKLGVLAIGALIAGLLQPVAAVAATMDVSIDDVGWANQESGSAVVTGVLRCDTPRTVTLYVQMKQQEREVQAERGKQVDCAGTERWMITLNPYGSGAFKAGIAGVDVEASSTGQETVQASETIGVKTCTIIGTTEPETIRGTPRKDIICGLHGSDRIFGEASNDVIRSYHGADYVNGGAGDDIVKAGYGRDEVYGNIGDDTLDGDEQSDYVDGGSGNDTCLGGTGRDAFSGCEKRDQDG